MHSRLLTNWPDVGLRTVSWLKTFKVFWVEIFKASHLGPSHCSPFCIAGSAKAGVTRPYNCFSFNVPYISCHNQA